MKNHVQPKIGVVEKYINLSPQNYLGKLSSTFQALKNYEVKPFGIGLPVVQSIIAHVFKTKLNKACQWKEDLWRKSYVVHFNCSLSRHGDALSFSQLKPNSFRDISPEFSEAEGADREKHALEYAQKIKEGVELGCPLYVTSAVLNYLGAELDDNEIYMLDGARRIEAMALSHRDEIEIQIIVSESELAELLDGIKCKQIQEGVAAISWFNNYQSIPLVGLQGERSVKRFSLMDMSLLRDSTVMDFGCNIGQACLNAVSAGAKKVYGVEGMPDTYKLASSINQAIGFDNLQYMNVNFNDADFDQQIDNVCPEQVDYAFFFSVYRTKELTQRERLFRYIISKARKGIFFEGHAHKVIDTVDYYDWLFSSFDLKYKFLGYSEEGIRPLFYIPLYEERFYDNNPIIDKNDYKYKVSAIVSTYASERFIEGRLDDLLNQTIADKIEIVVVDTGSPENEGEIVKRYMQEHDNIKYLRIDERETVYQAWNRGVKAASGQYLITANTDDRLRKDALEIMANQLDSNSEVALVYSDFFITPYDNMRFENHIRSGYSIKPDFVPQIMMSGCHMGSQPMWRSCIHQELGYFKEDLRYSADYEFWCRIATKYPLKYHHDFLGLYHHNPNSITNQNTEAMAAEAGLVKEMYAEKLPAVDRKTRTGFYMREHLEGQSYVNICMATYNRLEYTKEAISALLYNTKYPYVITVVDNNSSDGTRAYLESLKEKGIIKNLILLDDNLGVAKAMNIAWQLEPEAPYFLKLDNDMVVKKNDWLQDMIKLTDAIPQIATLAYNVEPKSYLLKEVQGLKFRVKKGNVGGACVLIRKDVHGKLGFWCEDYGFYGEEDFDYGFRAALSRMLNVYMEDEDAFFHLPAGKAAAINLENMEAKDGLEEIEDTEYREWKDSQRRVALPIRDENIKRYQNDPSQLYCKSEVFHLLACDLSEDLIADHDLINILVKIKKYLNKGRKNMVLKLIKSNFKNSKHYNELLEKVSSL